MKKLLSIFTLIISVGISNLAKADTASIIINSIPKDGFLLYEGWKFHPGHDPAWSSPAFVDSSWEVVDPFLNPSALPQLKNAGTGWLRFHFKAGKALRERLVWLILDLGVAAEVYLNGRLIKRYGTVSDSPGKVRPYSRNTDPIPLKYEGGAPQVLAIRYAYWQPLSWFNEDFFSYYFLADVRDPIIELETRRDKQKAQAIYLSLFGIFLFLSILHAAFYRYNPPQKANFYFALYAVCQCIGFLGIYFAWEVDAIQYNLALFTIFPAIVIMGNIWALRALYTLFNFKNSVIYAVTWIAFIVCMALFWFAELSWYPLAVIILLVCVEQVRLAIKALRQRKRGAGIVAFGFAGALMVILLLTALSISEIYLSQMVEAAIDALLFLFPALGISCFLAREFALDSKMLQLKLVQVEELSNRTVQQEKEKQQSLFEQNEMLERQVSERTKQLQESFDNLKSTQKQLIQSEKMASLGELTAGIAHEIQNPLNFINNFSDLNTELAEELKHELQLKNTDEALCLANDIQQNEEKINHHGKRADSIVKGMLQHSRASSGKKEPTDINALANEYLRLSYHGLRAKDKTFNANYKTDFDESLAKVEVVPQDIGRVLLNLYNNAFYAVNAKAKQSGGDYQPEVIVTTTTQDNHVLITARDNGNGIPQNILEKIYQPFFTTKPTGEGTGLGLSLSYDIIKAQGGEIKVNTTEGEGTEFIISIPTNQP